MQTGTLAIIGLIWLAVCIIFLASFHVGMRRKSDRPKMQPPRHFDKSMEEFSYVHRKR